MKISTNKRQQRVSLTRFALTLTPIAAGCAVLLSTAVGSVYAQETETVKSDDATPINTVVVTGIRRGIEAAISIKKNSSSIVEAISAEDIGKLPDTTVAAAIARLPGVTTQRSNSTGKATSISVRGLAPSFNGSLLNGREQASTGNSRSPEFDLFPAELIGSALIYKTPDATLIGSGLASTIDLHTLQPLDFGKRVLAVSLRKDTTGVGSPNPEGDGKNASFSYVDQFADRTIGLALGFTKSKDDGGGVNKFDSWGGGTSARTFNGVSSLVPNGFKADTEISASERNGVSATLQFKPNKDFKTSLDMFYSNGKASLKRTGLEGAIAGSAGGYDPDGVLSNAVISNGVATSGTLSNYKGVVRNHIESNEDTLTSIGWNSSLKVGDWTAVADLSHSKGKKDFVRVETTAGQPGNASPLGSISYTGFNGSNFSDVKYTTSLNYADRGVAQLTDVNGWGGGVNTPQAGYVAYPHIEDKVNSLRLSARRDLEIGPISGVQLGMNLTKRDKARTGDEGRLVVNGAGGYAVATAPGSETAVAGSLGIPIISFDPRGLVGSVYNLAKWVDASVLAKDWSVTEKVNTFYAMGELDGDVLNLPYKGNFGAQFVHTDQQTTGNKVDLATCTGITVETCPSNTISAGTKYSDVLPSMNLSFNLGSDQVLRFGAAKVISRANLDDMRASSAFGINTNGPNPILSGSGGNPDLKPFSAKTLDLSYEKYFGNKGYVSVAAFYKKLDTYVLRTPRVFDFKDQVSSATPLPASGPFAGSTVGLLTTPTNGEGGSIHGFELAVNIPFSMITPVLDGFGITVNHSDTSSAVSLPAVSFGTQNIAAASIPLPGLSKKVSNLRVYYEKAGFQVAWAARKRSDFLGQVSDFQDNAQLTFIKGETIVDIQASYEFQSGWFKGLTLLAQANNWTKTPYIEYNTDRNVSVFQIEPGRSYQVGVNYKF